MIVQQFVAGSTVREHDGLTLYWMHSECFLQFPIMFERDLGLLSTLFLSLFLCAGSLICFGAGGEGKGDQASEVYVSDAHDTNMASISVGRGRRPSV